MNMQGWKEAVSHHKMRITFGVISNHFATVIRNIANHFKVICESLFAKTPFFKVICESLFWSSSQIFAFFRHILCIWCAIANHFAKVCRKMQITSRFLRPALELCHFYTYLIWMVHDFIIFSTFFINLLGSIFSELKHNQLNKTTSCSYKNYAD